MKTIRPTSPSGRAQRGVATLVVTLIILAILTVIVLSSSSVALFEQKTSTNENRQKLADSAAEYALNLGTEYLKANVVKIASEQTLGWLPAGTAPHWVKCADVPLPMSASHPCMSEPVDLRRAEMYFWTASGAVNGSTSVPFNSLVQDASGQLSTVGKNFATTGTTVTALLCRLDTDFRIAGVLQPPQCRVTPSTGSNNRIAVTLVSRATLPGENASSEMKVTLGNFDTFAVGAAVPLVASGSINGVGNAEIVTAANGGGTGIPVSIWSAADADIDCTGPGSCASVSTCQVGEYLKATPESQLLTTCATVNNACGCPAMATGATKEIVLAKNPNMLSGHASGASNCCENIDILDIDRPTPTSAEGTPSTNVSRGVSPDITFFPGRGMDNVVGGAPVGATAAEIAAFDASAISDDSLFEWVFNVSGESITTKTSQADLSHYGQQGATLTNCTPVANCAVNYLVSASELNAQQVTCTQLNALGASASGLYYVVESVGDTNPDNDPECGLPAQVGTPDAPAIVVVNNKAKMNSTLLYGLLFLRSSNDTAELTGVGHAQVFGSVVVEGVVKTMAGGFTIVYSNTNVSKPGKDLPETTRFGQVPGSWLDNSRAGF